MIELIKTVLPYITGGIGGAFLNIIYTKHKGKIQIMECHYVGHEVISKIPVTITESGENHQNIYSKKFILKNTTNCDHKTFKIIFEFDINSKVIRYTDITKSGIDKLKKRIIKPNEYSITVQNFNRNDEVKFIFEIADIDKDEINVTEDECLGFKMTLKEKRIAKIESKLTIVNKEKINASH